MDFPLYEFFMGDYSLCQGRLLAGIQRRAFARPQLMLRCGHDKEWAAPLSAAIALTIARPDAPYDAGRGSFILSVAEGPRPRYRSRGPHRANYRRYHIAPRDEYNAAHYPSAAAALGCRKQEKSHAHGLESVPQGNRRSPRRAGQAVSRHSEGVSDSQQRERENHQAWREDAPAYFASRGGHHTLRWLHRVSHRCGSQGRRDSGRNLRNAGSSGQHERRRSVDLLGARPRRRRSQVRRACFRQRLRFSGSAVLQHGILKRNPEPDQTPSVVSWFLGSPQQFWENLDRLDLC